MLIDPVSMVVTLFCLAIYREGEVTSKYVVLSILMFAISFPGTWENSKKLKTEVFDTFSQWLLVFVVLLTFGYITRFLNSFPEDMILVWGVITPTVLLFSHLIANQYLSSAYYISSVKKTAVIVGVNDLSHQLQQRIKASKENGIELKSFFDVDSERKPASALAAFNPLVGKIEELAEYVKKYNIDIIYIALPPSLHIQIMMLLDDLKDTTASIYFVPNFFLSDLIQARIDEIDGMPIVAMCETPFSGFNGFIKGISDLVLASLILMIVSPLMLLLAVGVKLSSPGPIIFKQRRCGLDGTEIIVYKFRSMRVLEDGDVVIQAKSNDSRVTRFGKFLRKTSLDELPQFINVLQGSMSIVGPRPHAISHNEMYRKVIKGYMVRHKVKPGITGLAQVNGYRGETATVESMKARIDYDIAYLKKWSLRLDIKIILKTVLLIFKDAKAY